MDLSGLTELPDWALHAIEAGGVLVGALVVNWLARFAVARMVTHFIRDQLVADEQRNARVQTIVGVLRTAVSALVWAIALLFVLDAVGLNIGPLLAAAGIGGISLGFGAQNVVRDTLAGFFIILEDQYHVADVVRIAGVSGRVEAISLRTTTLRDLEGGVHVVPNGEIRVSTNLTKGFSRYVIDLPVPYEAEVDKVVDVVREAFDKMRTEDRFAPLIRGPLEVLGVDSYGPSEVVVKMYVETLPGRQWEVGRELRRRIKLAYDEAGISIPYPHQEMIIKRPDGAEPGI